MKKFNIIKRSRKNSEDIDEKIEYLNKECQKTGLNEITMSTSGIYQGSTQVPNQDFIDFESKSQDGYPLGLSGADGNNAGNANLINGVAYSPPHPVTGVRRSASHVRDGLGGTEPLKPGQITFRGFGNNPPPYTMGSALWFFDADFDNGAGQPAGKWCNLEWSNFPNSIGWGFWDTVKTGQFAGLYFFNTDLSQHPCGDVSGLIGLINFGTNGALGSLQTTVLTQNRMDDPTHIPIGINEMSPQAFEYFRRRVNGDDIARTTLTPYEEEILRNQLNHINRTLGPEAGRREQQRLMQMYGIYFPLASNPNPLAGAQDGDEFAFLPFGGGNNNKPFDPTKKQSRRDTINLINAVNSGDPLYLPPGVTMDQAREFVRNRDNGNLTEKFKLRNLKTNVKVDNDDTKKFNIIKKSRKKSKGIDEKIEYLEKECQKTGLNEIANSTTGLYSVLGSEPNPDHEDFKNASVNGLPLGFAGANHQIDAPLINGAVYSPPHPITGERYAAGTWKGILTGFRPPLIPGFKKNEQSRPHGDVLWFWDPNVGTNGNWRYVEKVSNQWCVWIDNAFGSMSAVPYFSANSYLPDDIKNALTAAGILGFTDPEKFGPPTNPILFQNDLGDPSHIPINIDGLSPEAYNYLDTASSGYSDDTYNWYVKTYGAGAAGWYMNNPNSHPSNNPFLPRGAYTPFTDRASNPTDDKTEIALPPAAILAAMAALGIAIKGAESAWKLYRKYKQQIDQKVKEMQAAQGQTA